MANRDNEFRQLYDRAVAAGKAAAAAKSPQMMQVRNVQTGKVYAPFPICGFAWVRVRPGNCPFANWLKKNGIAGKAYGGGVDIWISDYNQSYDLKLEHAMAMAHVFEGAGINAYGNGRLD